MELIFGSFLLKLIVGLVVLAILIFVHELGHFLVAKFFGVGVLEFSIGFGRKIWRRRIGETRYSIGVIPLGGYVRMVGDEPSMLEERMEEPADKSEDSDQEEQPSFKSSLLEEIEESSDPVLQALWEDKSRWFLSQGYWAKVAIVFAGPLFNFLFAWFLAAGVFITYGTEEQVEGAVLGEVFENFPAYEAGLKSGDQVLAVGGVEVSTWDEFRDSVRASDGAPVVVRVERSEGEGAEAQVLDLTLSAQLEDEEVALLTGREDERSYVIGVAPQFVSVPVTFGESLLYGARHVVGIGVLALRGVHLMIVGSISTKNIGGPITIMRVAAHSAQEGVRTLLLFMIFLSVSLGIINLFPVPILDGGHIVFFTIEAIRGKALSLRVQEAANHVGLVVLLALMLFAVWNDIVNFPALGSGGPE